MIFFRKYFFKIIVSVFIIAFLVIAPFPLFNKINALNYSFNSEYQLNYSGVLELWNVDTFEGGSVSRTAYLEKRAQEFEKQNKGVFIQVKNITLEQLENNLKNNNIPTIEKTNTTIIIVIIILHKKYKIAVNIIAPIIPSRANNAASI